MARTDTRTAAGRAELLELLAGPRCSDLTADEIDELPLTDLGIWRAAAGNRSGSAALRRRLVRAATRRNFVTFSGLPDGLRAWDRQARLGVLHTLLTPEWLTSRRLAAIVEAHVRTFDQEVLAVLLGHRQSTVPLVATYLFRAGQRNIGQTAAAAGPILRAAVHPYPVLADLLEVMSAAGGDRQPWARWTAVVRVGCELVDLPAIAAQVLIGLLPTWTGTFEAAVKVARDVAGQTAARDLAEDLRWVQPGSSDWRRAYAYATDPGTSVDQLGLLPLHHLEVWAAVADRRQLPAVLRTELMDAALSGLSGRRNGEPVTDWQLRRFQVMLASRWLTSRRLVLLAGRAPADVAAAPAAIAALAAHPRPVPALLAVLASSVTEDCFTARVQALRHVSAVGDQLGTLVEYMDAAAGRRGIRWGNTPGLRVLAAAIGDPVLTDSGRLLTRLAADTSPLSLFLPASRQRPPTSSADPADGLTSRLHTSQRGPRPAEPTAGCGRSVSSADHAEAVTG
jgi:hypothetical protein